MSHGVRSQPLIMSVLDNGLEMGHYLNHCLFTDSYIDGLVQETRNSIANAL